MQVMYQYPEVVGLEADMMAVGPVAELARVAEESGFSGFAFTEHPAPGLRWLETGGHQTLDPYIALGYVAAVTTRLKLLTYLSVLPYRNPMLQAKSAATVDILSEGRMILGVGAGYSKSEFHALGVDFDERNALFDEALEVMPLHWSGEPFSYQGLHFSARDVVARPRPVQQPIPIWIGGNSKLTRRRVAQRAAGWMPMLGPESLFAATRTPQLTTPADLRAAVGELREAAGDRGGSLDIAVAYSDPELQQPGADFGRHRETLAELKEAGATWIIIAGQTDNRDDSVAFLERFGREVVSTT